MFRSAGRPNEGCRTRPDHRLWQPDACLADRNTAGLLAGLHGRSALGRQSFGASSLARRDPSPGSSSSGRRTAEPSAPSSLCGLIAPTIAGPKHGMTCFGSSPWMPPSGRSSGSARPRPPRLDRAEAGIAAAGPRQGRGADGVDDVSGNGIANLDYSEVKQVGTALASGHDLRAEPLRRPVRIQSRARPARSYRAVAIMVEPRRQQRGAAECARTKSCS